MVANVAQPELFKIDVLLPHHRALPNRHHAVLPFRVQTALPVTRRSLAHPRHLNLKGFMQLHDSRAAPPPSPATRPLSSDRRAPAARSPAAGRHSPSRISFKGIRRTA